MSTTTGTSPSKSKKFNYSSISDVFVEYNTGGSTKNKWIQLLYLNKVLDLNKINILTRIRVNLSYILNGIYNFDVASLSEIELIKKYKPDANLYFITSNSTIVVESFTIPSNNCCP